ncbi:MAG: amino acid adenylation domain-containing protein [Thermoanaerobaculales bacterium]|jgi:amino acid adenylation domain-containing protein|nr:amino acid adenylation domain-containing protein [Thermoanaerobaculales bacterium]
MSIHARSATTGGALTHSQLQILIGQRLHPASPLYNMAFAFVLPADLDREVFRRAWREVADASDVLRTRISTDPSGQATRSMRDSARETVVVELDDGGVTRDDFDRWCADRCRRPLELSGELVDSVLVPLADGRTGWYLNQHHLVCDAWSTELLVRQVSDTYLAMVDGRPDRPGAPADSYPTAAALLARTGNTDAARAHWRDRDHRPGRIAPLYGRSASPTDTPSTRETLVLDEARTRALDALCAAEGFASPSFELARFNLFATALSAWLSRVGGGDEVGFDAPVAGRPTADAKRALGCFIELFPFAAEVRPDDTFRSLASRCLDESMRFLTHAQPGLSSPSAASASNIVLNYVPVRFGEIAGRPADVTWVHPGHGDSVHALRLQVHDFSGSGRTTLHFDCNDGVLPEPLRHRIAGHFARLLDAVLADPDRRIAEIDLVLDDEIEMLGRLNDTGGAPLADRTIVDRFEACVRLHPDRVALRQGGVELRFGELADRVLALAAVIRAHGVEPGDRVVVAGRRSVETVTAILAALRARAAYVPVDPSAPASRLAEIVDDSGATLVLAAAGSPHDRADATVPVLDIAETVAAQAGVTELDAGPRLDDVAYLIYTSGSTGRPKGVVVDHLGLAEYLGWAEQQYVRGERLTFALFTSLAFDLTVTSLFLPLISGGTLEIYPEPDGPVDTALMDVAEADAADLIKLTPSHLALLVRIGLEGSRIRRMVLGGENLPTRLAAAANSQLDGRLELTNEYGPTEAVVGCVAHCFDPAADSSPDVPIGRPADHVTVEILNESGTAVPVGVPGELWVSRPGLARGYHGLDDLTNERFRPDPAGRDRRRYRTGDRVRLREDGVLEYLGRLDRQLKVSGFRVEPGEIEHAVRSLPGITDCAVIARRPAAAATGTGSVRHCVRCGLATNVPKTALDDDGVCSVCRTFESIEAHAADYFKSEDELRAVFDESRRTNTSDYDCLMLYSGGKDSSYALCRLVDMGLRVYAFTLDNGYISEGAKENIRRITSALDVPIEFATTPAMKAIFRDSLMRFSNVCNGCFKTIYTLSMQRAHELGIPIIVTGLSRGQMFETRLTEDMFRGGRCSPEEVDDAVLAARKVYHRVPDEATRSLDTSIFADDRIFSEIRFVDFYRYVDVGLDEVYRYLGEQAAWSRPTDTGRSTNCLINDVGIWVHQTERGFHNYALPYSWDVRMGHKTRDDALDELDDDIDLERVETILEEIGYEPEPAGGAQSVLEAYYVADEERLESELRAELAEILPGPLVPVRLGRVDAIPLAASGKVDERALAAAVHGRLPERPYRAPDGPVEEFLADLWQTELGVERVGADDSFFSLGGSSLTAMQVMLQLCREYDIDLPLESLFSHPVLAELARLAEDRILADVEEMRTES